MADYYTEFSVELGNLTKEEKTWLVDFLDEYPEDKYEDEKFMKEWTKPRKQVIKEAMVDDVECWPEVDYIGESGCLYLFSEESRNPDFTAYVIQEFLKKFRPDDYVTFEWAYTCSKPRPEGFGGGAAFITAKKVSIMGTSNWLYQKENQFNNRRKKSAQISAG